MEKHQGTWTRQNRNNNNEKSIIDYIITSNHLAAKVLESTTEDGTTNLIRGNDPTDHNIITATLDITVQRERKTTQQWKRGQPKDWENFNQALATDWRNLNANKQDYQNLQKIIIKNLVNKIGSRTITLNKKNKISNAEIKSAKQSGKSTKPCSMQHANTTTQVNSYTWSNT